jgi:hypothetical protein
LEDDWDKLGIGRVDVALLHVHFADDLRASVLKLDAPPKRFYIVTVVGDGPYDAA